MLFNKITQENGRQLIVCYSDKLPMDCVITCKKTYAGDWICISDSDMGSETLSPIHTRKLLGQEFLHAIFDARRGFHLDAFLILAGTLKAGSLLILVLPTQFGKNVDLDTIRWNDLGMPTAAPNFATHLQRVFEQHSIPAFINIAQLETAFFRSEWIAPYRLQKSIPTPEQQAILTSLQEKDPQIAVLTAKRGRGKSALAGFFTHYQTTWICVAHKKSAHTLRHFSAKDTRILAPDELISALKSGCCIPPWIIVDEAAMIPIVLLNIILFYARHILFISTMDGYEGTGQGFWLGFIKRLIQVEYYYLETPIRFGKQDPLEAVMDAILLAKEGEPVIHQVKKFKAINYEFCCQNTLAGNVSELHQFYSLLKCAHYKTTPTDLRRLLDAKKIKIVRAYSANQTVAAALIVKEGGIDSALSQKIWCGVRRPKGSLVAQSLVAHANERIAAELRSLRINRLAVYPELRRNGLGQNVVNYIIRYGRKQNYDFISASFSCNAENYAFWLACGFHLVHLGFHCETSTGNYSMMVMKSLTVMAEQMQQRLSQRLHRNISFYPYHQSLHLFVKRDNDMDLANDDWRSLVGFAYGNSSYNMAYAALCRLQYHYPQLELELSPQQNSGLISGKKERMKARRDQVKRLLQQKGITMSSAEALFF